MSDPDALGTMILAVIAAILRDEGMDYEDALDEAQKLCRLARVRKEEL